MPKNEEFSKNVDNVNYKVNKNSNELTDNGQEVKGNTKAKKTTAKKTTSTKATNQKNSKSVKVEKDSKSKNDRAPKASTAKKPADQKSASVKNVKKDTSTSNAKKATKKIEPKKGEVKKVETKKAAPKKITPKKETKVAKEEKVETKVEDKSLVDVNELTIIDRIKSFLAKIAAMQEEARKESQGRKEEKAKAKVVEKEIKEAKKAAAAEAKKPEYLLEYYDLPYRYNETIVKILAQTPKKLFVYWDISDNDREKYVKTFGEDFFNKTYPVLLLYNEDKKYVREIVINDFANSWYINIDDSKTKYSIQLGRKFKEKPQYVNMAEMETNKIILHTDYLPIANSNKLEVPNDHVLLETLPRFIVFRNVKTGKEVAKDLGQLKFVLGKAHNVKEFYESHYKDEVTGGIFDMANPSSRLTSSSFK